MLSMQILWFFGCIFRIQRGFCLLELDWQFCCWSNISLIKLYVLQTLKRPLVSLAQMRESDCPSSNREILVIGWKRWGGSTKFWCCASLVAIRLGGLTLCWCASVESYCYPSEPSKGSLESTILSKYQCFSHLLYVIYIFLSSQGLAAIIPCHT